MRHLPTPTTPYRYVFFSRMELILKKYIYGLFSFKDKREGKCMHAFEDKICVVFIKYLEIKVKRFEEKF